MGTEGIKNGQFTLPYSMVFDSKGNIYVIDTIIIEFKNSIVLVSLEQNGEVKIMEKVIWDSYPLRIIFFVEYINDFNKN
jgi:hypothetical protein